MARGACFRGFGFGFGWVGGCCLLIGTVLPGGWCFCGLVQYTFLVSGLGLGCVVGLVEVSIFVFFEFALGGVWVWVSRFWWSGGVL